MHDVNKKPKPQAIGVRLTAEQLDRIDRIVAKSRKETGFEVNRGDVIRKLIDVGLARVERV